MVLKQFIQFCLILIYPAWVFGVLFAAVMLFYVTVKCCAILAVRATEPSRVRRVTGSKDARWDCSTAPAGARWRHLGGDAAARRCRRRSPRSRSTR